MSETNPSHEAPPTVVASVPADPHAPVVVTRKVPHHGHEGRGIFAFLGWLFTGFGLFHVLKHGGEFRENEVTVYSVHRAFFLWPIVLLGFIGGVTVHFAPGARSFFGWVYVWVLAYTLVGLLFDISTWKFLLWAGIFAFVYILSLYLHEHYGIDILAKTFHYVLGLGPQLDYGTAMLMSWLMLIPWIGALFHTFTNGRKRFTPNEISEWHLGVGSELTDRSGLMFRTNYRDLFETALGFGAGDLLAVDNTGVVRKRWENILFLTFTWPKLNAILDQRAAVVDNSREEPVEVEEVRHK